MLAPAVFTATATGGAPAALERVSSLVGSTAAGFEAPDSVAIRVSDRFGHPVAGANVAFAVTAGGGSVSPATVTTASDGVARAAWTIGATGTQTLTASASGFTTNINATAIACPAVTLAVGQAMTIQPGAAQCLTVSGSAQHYLLTVVNPTNSPTSFDQFRVRGAGSSTALTSANEMLATSRPLGAGLSPQDAERIATLQSQTRAHARALQASYDLMARLPAPTSRERQAAIVAAGAAAPPAVGDIITMQLPKNFNDLCDNSNSTNPDVGSAKISGRVVYVGTHSVMVEDQSDPLVGRFDTLYVKVGQEFDNVMWPILTTNFGNPLAMDEQLNGANAIGKVFMLFSHSVNEIDQGNLAGFVSSSDDYPPTVCPTSNTRPTFYARVPTSTGLDDASDMETPSGWYRAMRAVIIHETKHVVSFAEKFSRNGGHYPGNSFGTLDQWLEESSAMLSEELWARVIFGYAQNGNVTYQQSVYCEVRTSPTNSPQCQPGTALNPSSTLRPATMLEHFFYLYDYMHDPEDLSIVGPVKSNDFTFYGVGWLFLRWIVDNYAASEPSFLMQMTDQVTNPGIAELENLTHRTFPDLLADFSIALALDDYPGFSPVDPKHKISSWNLPDIFAGASKDYAAGTPYFNLPKPLNLHATSFGKFSVDVSAIHGGGMSMFDVTGTQSAKQLFEFKGPSGTDFPADMRISVVRVK